MTITILGLLLSGCAHRAEVAPQTSGPSEYKTGAPVAIEVRTTGSHSVITATPSMAAAAFELHVWGASGLELAGDSLRWAGDVRAGQVIEVEVTHAGAGDLAVRAEGTFLGERIDEVRSFTVGVHAPTVVPTEHGAKG